MYSKEEGGCRGSAKMHIKTLRKYDAEKKKTHKTSTDDAAKNIKGTYSCKMVWNNLWRCNLILILLQFHEIIFSLFLYYPNVPQKILWKSRCTKVWMLLHKVVITWLDLSNKGQSFFTPRCTRNLSNTPPILRNIICQKWEGNCGLWVLNLVI